MESSMTTHSPSGAARSRSTIRPRSQREVVANGAGVSRTATLRAPARAAVIRAADGIRAVDGPDVAVRSLVEEACAANRHHCRAGQPPQSGRRGRQNVAPTSMSAWVQSAGRSGGTTESAIACSSDARSTRASPATIRPRTRRTFVSTAPMGWPNAIDATTRAVYGPTPGNVNSARRSAGTRPSCCSTM